MMEPELNIQPLDALMIRLGLTNADLVGSSKAQLTFKMLQKGRKGKQLTPNAKNKILEAFEISGNKWDTLSFCSRNEGKGNVSQFLYLINKVPNFKYGQTISSFCKLYL